MLIAYVRGQEVCNSAQRKIRPKSTNSCCFWGGWAFHSPAGFCGKCKLDFMGVGGPRETGCLIGRGAARHPLRTLGLSLGRRLATARTGSNIGACANCGSHGLYTGTHNLTGALATSCGVRRPINDPGIPLHSTGEARHTYWSSPSAGRRRGHCQRPQVRIGAQGQSCWRVSCGHEQGVGVTRCCCRCGCGCGWLLLPVVCEVLLVWLLVFLASSMLNVQSDGTLSIAARLRPVVTLVVCTLRRHS
jgi:hypothetical protein